MPDAGGWIERKNDGWRCLFFRGTDGVTRLWTRNGMPLEGADHVLHRLKLFEEAAGGPLFIDGEIVLPDAGTGTLAATKAWFESGWKLGGEAGTFHAFDVLTLRDWQAGGTPTPLYRRREWLRELAEQVGEPWDWRPGSHGRDEAGPTPVQIVEEGWAFSGRDTVEQAVAAWGHGWEGLVLKDPESPYQRTRNGLWAKIKQENIGKWQANV